MDINPVVRIYDIRAARVMDIVQELRDSGLKQGENFDFAYTPPYSDDWKKSVQSMAEFTFYQPALATMFTLKYLK